MCTGDRGGTIVVKSYWHGLGSWNQACCAPQQDAARSTVGRFRTGKSVQVVGPNLASMSWTSTSWRASSPETPQIWRGDCHEGKVGAPWQSVSLQRDGQTRSYVSVREEPPQRCPSELR